LGVSAEVIGVGEGPVPAQGFRAVGESAGGGQGGVAVAFAELFNRGTFRRRLPIRAVVTTYFTGFEVVFVHGLSLWLLDGFVSSALVVPCADRPKLGEPGYPPAHMFT